MENLKWILHRLQDAGLKLKTDKCKFMQDSVVYLGHKIDDEGIHPSEEKVSAILEAPAPKNIMELQSYLGMLNYYHKFLKNISTIAAPMYRLLKKEEQWEWAKLNKRHSRSQKD